MDESSTPALEQLRAATRAHWQRLDRDDFARTASAGALPAAYMASYLRALHAVYSELEQVVEQSADANLRALYSDGGERRARIERDLAALGCDRHGLDEAVLHALVLGQQIRRSAPALLGELYVFEHEVPSDARLTHAWSARPAPSFFAAARTPERQASFFRALDADLQRLNDAGVAHTLAGARTALQTLEAVRSAIASRRSDPPTRAETLNVDAGAHPLPDDVREVQAALHAGEASFRRWAYYEVRYGERGLRFTRSDSAWLVTLSREPATVWRRQVRWLGHVLATRGMPRLLLEQHLALLHRSLIAFLPERADDYEALHSAASELAAERRAHLGDEELERLAADFDPPAGALATLSRLEVGRLIAAAAVDERLGVDTAVHALCDWLSAAAPDDSAWRSAIARTLQASRAACR